jgi:hypothetical protein
MVTKSRGSILTELRGLDAGIAKNMGSRTTILAGVTYTAAQLRARIKVSLDAETSIADAKAALATALLAGRRVRTTEAAFIGGLRKMIQTGYGPLIDKLAEFGVPPKKPPPKRTTYQRLVMSAKNQATRKKRGTLSKKQKKAIKGNVTGVVITPVLNGRKLEE